MFSSSRRFKILMVLLSILITINILLLVGLAMFLASFFIILIKASQLLQNFDFDSFLKTISSVKTALDNLASKKPF